MDLTSLFRDLLTIGGTIIGVLIANSKQQAVTEVKIEELTREVREHNNFARRVPLLERDVEELKKYHPIKPEK